MVMPRPVEIPTYELSLIEMVESLAIDSGNVTSTVYIGGNTLQDATKNWAANIHKNRLVKIIGGPGIGQLAVILSNTVNTLVIKGTWKQALVSTSIYAILNLDTIQVLKDAFGSGSNVSEENPLPVRLPKIDEDNPLPIKEICSGIPYSNNDTATDDEARRFETDTLILRDAVIKVTTHNQLFGDATEQNFELAAGGSIAVSFLDLSLFYFCNAILGSNGTIQIFGTRC